MCVCINQPCSSPRSSNLSTDMGGSSSLTLGGEMSGDGGSGGAGTKGVNRARGLERFSLRPMSSTAASSLNDGDALALALPLPRLPPNSEMMLFFLGRSLPRGRAVSDKLAGLAWPARVPSPPCGARKSEEGTDDADSTPRLPRRAW